jgi:ubiquitin conjugation factor E4 B
MVSQGDALDAALGRIFAVCLDERQANGIDIDGRPTRAGPAMTHLAGLAEELMAEGLPAKITPDTMDRILWARLLYRPPPGQEVSTVATQWPVHYLLGCYARATAEARGPLGRVTEVDASGPLTKARQIIVSYCGILLSAAAGEFPQPEPAQQRGALQLLDAAYAAVQASLPMGTSSSFIPNEVLRETTVTPMPAGFLEDFAVACAEEGFPEALEVMVKGLMRDLSSMSILGDITAPLMVLEGLVSMDSVAAALVMLPCWLPDTTGVTGRMIEQHTVLGPAFGIGAIPDLTARSSGGLQTSRAPDVVETYFGGENESMSNRTKSAIDSLQKSLAQLHAQLHRVVKTLLKNPASKGPTMKWFGAVLAANHERTKMHPDIAKASSDSFIVNFGAVLLELARPFIDPRSGRAWLRLDSRYASDPTIAWASCFEEDTRLGMSNDELQNWVSRWLVGLGDNKVEYHFICEVFFMTAMALRMGYVKSFETVEGLARQAESVEREAESLGQSMQAAAYKRFAKRCRGTATAIMATIQCESLLDGAVGFYGLVAAYLLRCATNATQSSGSAPSSPSLPLPEPAPPEFASLPEFLVEDLCTVLIAAGRTRPDLVGARRMEDYVVFFTVFLGSLGHVKNPYLRGRMVEALFSYMPQEGRIAAHGAAEEVALAFEVHPLVVGHMVRSLIALYVDIERTDRHNTFYEKFNTRYQIGMILAHLWHRPGHRIAWRAVAGGEPRLYIRFINMLINDSQHLLQEALETLPAVQDLERAIETAGGMEGLAPQDRAEKQAAMERYQRTLRSDFALADIYLKTMRDTSEDAQVAFRFFDVQVRDRQARILDFFLRYLTLPLERRRLKLKEPERYGWRPRELITSLAAIHVNLFRVNREEWTAAVASDTDYYGKAPEMFDHLIAVLTSIGFGGPAELEDLRALADGAARVAAAAEEEEAYEDVPEEFEDPLSCRLMKDPVRLPSGNVVDRSTILQHLLTDQRDPFSRAPMTEEDLEGCADLAARIRAWVEERRAGVGRG